MGFLVTEDLLQIAKAIAVREQPRQAVNESNRRALPHAKPIRQQQSSLLQVVPLDCRLLIWEYILQPSQTRIERWRPDTEIEPWVTRDQSDTDCFPYRMTTARPTKTEKPLNLLLCCRQLYLEGLSILYSSTFVFEMPLDLYSFQLCVCPEGLSSVKSLVIALGQIDSSGIGPFFSYDRTRTKHPNGSLEEWKNAVHGLKRMRSVHELQVWLGHSHIQKPELERRPWKKHQANETLEQRHHKLFDLFGTVDVPNFTAHLTWKPEDLLSRRKWPFRIELHTKDEMMHVTEDELPEKTAPDLYCWC